MQNTTKQTLSNLLKNSSEEKEVHFNIGDEVLRLNLKPDDILSLIHISEPTRPY